MGETHAEIEKEKEKEKERERERAKERTRERRQRDDRQTIFLILFFCYQVRVGAKDGVRFLADRMASLQKLPRVCSLSLLGR
jgi:hypothetical protein